MTAVIIGGSRGIGLGFVEAYLKRGYDVVTTYRGDTPPKALQNLQTTFSKKLSLHQLDVRNLSQIQQLAETVKKVNLLIINAGIKGCPVSGTRPDGNTEEELHEALRVNTIGPNSIMQAFYPHLSRQKNACAVYMSSRVGVTSDNSGGGYHPYRISKAATNAAIWNWCIELMKKWAQEHPKRMTNTPCAFAICPGWVKTDMGGSNANLTVEESVSKMIEVIHRLRRTKECNAIYMYDGTQVEKYPVPEVLQEVFQKRGENRVAFV